MRLALLLAGVAVSACASPAPLATVFNPAPRLPAPIEGAALPPGTFQAAPTTGTFPPAPLPGDVPVVYPEFERRAGVTGTPVVRCLVDTTGAVVDAEVVGSVSPGLDAVALEYATKTRFTPGRVDGVPTAMTVDLPVEFRLQTTLL
jgi:TonB family protein